MTQKEAQDYLASKFNIYRPSEPSTKIVFCSHGNHTHLKGTSKALIDKKKDLNLEYLGPHGYTLQGGLQTPFDMFGGIENYTKAHNGQQEGSNLWYNYELTSFTFTSSYDKEINSSLEYQRIANESGMNTMQLKEGMTSTTEELLEAIAASGYTSIVAIYCRGEQGIDSPEYFPSPGNDPNELIPTNQSKEIETVELENFCSPINSPNESRLEKEAKTNQKTNTNSNSKTPSTEKSNTNKIRR